MAGTRGHVREDLIGLIGGQLKALNGATVYVYQVGSSTQVGNLYTTSSGVATYTQPLTATSSGEVEFWVDGEQNVDLTVSATGYTTVTKTTTALSPDTVVPAATANPAFQVDTVSNLNSVTGIKITANAASSGVAMVVTSTGTNEPLTIAAKGSGQILLNSMLQNELVGQLDNLPAARVYTIDASYKALAFATYTVNGTLTVNGEFRITGWPT